MTRHPNCKPVSLGEHKPAVSMSGQTKRAQHSEIELLTRDYLANGGEIEQVQTQKSEFKPTWAAYAASAMGDE